MSVAGVRLRRRQVLGPRSNASEALRAAQRVRSAVDLAAAAEQAAAAAHKAEKATEQQLEVAAEAAEVCQAGGQPYAIAPSCTQWPSTQPLFL